MAMARSVARRNADTNSGTRSGTIAFAFCMMFPLSKSAPRAIWAFMILSVSSMRMGIKRRAMDIIMAISWTGTLNFFRKPRPFSMPSVRAFGVVVRVITVEPSTRKMRRSAMKPATFRPSFVTFRMPSEKITSPFVRNRLKLTLMRSSTRMPFSPRTM